jgi:hypothetical protein
LIAETLHLAGTDDALGLLGAEADNCGGNQV